MKSESHLKIIIEVNDKATKRKFHPSFQNTKFGQGLKFLQKRQNAILEALPGMRDVIRKVLAKDFELFLQPQLMPWYLDVITQRIISQKSRYRINVKACRDHTFFDVSFLDKRTKKGPKLLLSPFFHATPVPKSTDEQDLLGLADTFLFLAPLLKDLIEKADRDKKKIELGRLITDAIEWVRVELNTEKIKPTLASSTSKQYELDVQASAFWDDSPVAAEQKSISFVDNDGEPKEVIVSSKNVREAIGLLSEAWHNPIAGSILLSAGSGSGKEVLQDILTYALSVNGVTTISLAAPQLASRDEPLKELLEAVRERGLIGRRRIRGRYVLTRVPLFFLDEIHQDSAQRLREQLLRVLETKELTDGREKYAFKKARYLFAASEPPEKLRSRNPPDFWTRVEYQVVMNHPLRLESREEINETLQQFFCKFWRKAAQDWRAQTNDQKTNGIIERLCPGSDDKKVVRPLAEVFADTLDSPLIPTISIRLLRSIINRLFSRAIYHVRTHKVEGNELKAISSEMDKWIIDIFNEIVPEIKPEGVF